jgi:hypothetical protein
MAYHTLIGAPHRGPDDVFELPLIIDERCELMGDHQRVRTASNAPAPK